MPRGHDRHGRQCCQQHYHPARNRPRPWGADRTTLGARSFNGCGRDRPPMLRAPLKDRFGDSLTLLNQDFLQFDFSSLEGRAPHELVVVGNIPYHITTQILLKLIANRRYFTNAFLLMQQEYASRLLAQPNTKAYGRISVLVQLLYQVEELLPVPAHFFTPLPKVGSSFVSLTARPHGLSDDDVRRLENLPHCYFATAEKSSVQSAPNMGLPSRANITTCARGSFAFAVSDAA